MKLAEALSLRSDLQSRVDELKSRMKASAKVTEGDEPAEKIDDLFAELDRTLEQLEDLVYRINETNFKTVCDGENITRMIARRDRLSSKTSALRELLSHVTENDSRYGRNELKQIRFIKVTDLRKMTDSCACSLRELDMKLQNLNWITDLA